jgi:hypothetical protein
VPSRYPGTPSHTATHPPPNQRQIPGFQLPSATHVPQQNVGSISSILLSHHAITDNKIRGIVKQFDVLFPTLDPAVRSSVTKDLESVHFSFFFNIFFIQSFRFIHIHSYTRTLVHSFIHSFIHSYIHTFIHDLLVRSCARIFIHSYIHTFIHSYTHTLVHSYIHQLINSSILHSSFIC